ncbi:MAG: DNA repair protein RecO [Gemmatimonadaceae bacterium]|nr:DNA repair protein RecO [Gemmatimonadaceae bacterium]
MAALDTEALVLHLFDYRETSRIVRFVTRDAGVVSVVARGARRPRNRYGAALDLFASGTAQVMMHESGDLHALHAFEAARSRRELALSLDRFVAAAMIGEMCLRFGSGDEPARVFDAAVGALDAITAAPEDGVSAASLAGAWRLVSELGFAPSLDRCASCHGEIEAGADVAFHNRAGGALCRGCASNAPGGRRLPASARATLRAWLAASGAAPGLQQAEARAHARMLRRFLDEHVGDGRPLRAFVAWEDRLAIGGRAGTSA